MKVRGTFWASQAPRWFLVIHLIRAQGISAFDYGLGVAVGRQEPGKATAEVGAALWCGFALGDLVTQVTVRRVGSIDQLSSKRWTEQMW